MTDLLAFVRAQLDETERDAQSLLEVAQRAAEAVREPRLLGREMPGWFAWVNVEAMCARELASVEADRSALDLHKQIECVNCEAKARKPGTSCVRCHHGESDYGEQCYDGTCSTVRALAQKFTGRPGWHAEWTNTPAPLRD